MPHTDQLIVPELKLLIPFVEFVARLPQATKEDQRHAQSIVSFLQRIETPADNVSWNVCLDIFDFELQGRFRPGEGVYWRNWWIHLEGGSLEIEAETHHTEEPLYHWGDDFCFHSLLMFNRTDGDPLEYWNPDVQPFVDDAMQYRRYVTAQLKEVEIRIEFKEG